MTDKILKLHASKEIGEEVTNKEAHFLKLLDPGVQRAELLKPLTNGLMDRIQVLRDKARRNLEHEQQEM